MSNVGLKLTTPRLRVRWSTDWASQAPHTSLIFNTHLHLTHGYVLRFTETLPILAVQFYHLPVFHQSYFSFQLGVIRLGCLRRKSHRRRHHHSLRQWSGWRRGSDLVRLHISRCSCAVRRMNECLGVFERMSGSSPQTLKHTYFVQLPGCWAQVSAVHQRSVHTGELLYLAEYCLNLSWLMSEVPVLHLCLDWPAVRLHLGQWQL